MHFHPRLGLPLLPLPLIRFEATDIQDQPLGCFQDLGPGIIQQPLKRRQPPGDSVTPAATPSDWDVPRPGSSSVPVHYDVLSARSFGRRRVR